MAKAKNKHGPGCMLCAYEKRQKIKAGFSGRYMEHRYCDNPKPCNGFMITPPEYKRKEICATYRGGGARRD
jgi:hypothetical protein